MSFYSVTMKYLFTVFIAACVASFAYGATHVNENAETFEPSPHIVGGSRVSPLSREYAVWLRMKKYPVFDYCNGVRLNERWILTAAECLTKLNYDHARFTVAQNGKYVYRYFSIDYVNYTLHPNYNAATKENNIALIERELTIWDGTDQTKHIKLPSKSDSVKSHEKEIAEVTGYERTADPQTGEEIAIVNGLQVSIVPPNRCHGLSPQSSDQLCAIPLYAGKPRGLSKHDVGVPLVLQDGTLFGIALKVEPLVNDLAKPIVFARIAPYLEWISRITKIALRE